MGWASAAVPGEGSPMQHVAAQAQAVHRRQRRQSWHLRLSGCLPAACRPALCCPARQECARFARTRRLSISIAPFCVSTTATTSPRFTASPGFTSHSTSVPASMSAPSEGIRKSTTLSHRPMRLRGRDDLADLRDARHLEMRGIGNRHLGAADPRQSGHRVRRTPRFHDARRSRRRGCRCASPRRRSPPGASLRPTPGWWRRRAAASVRRSITSASMPSSRRA